MIQWHVIHTKPRQEKALACDLNSMGIEHYLPVRDEARYHGRQKRLTQLPLFPGYLFLRGTLEQAYEADRTRRVVQLIRVANQGQLDGELGQIRRAIDLNAPLAPYPYLIEGRQVEVRSGPFRGLKGIVAARGGNSRLILGVNMLGQGVTLEIEGSLLEPLEPDSRLRACGHARPIFRDGRGVPIGLANQDQASLIQNGVCCDYRH